MYSPLNIRVFIYSFLWKNIMATETELLMSELRNFTKKLGLGLSSLDPMQRPVAQWQSLSQQGINFSGDAIGLQTSIKTTRMSVDEWSNAISAAQQGFTSLGGSMDESAKRFNILSREFSDTSAADSLKQIGYTTGEYNEVLALTLASNRRLTLQDASSKAEAFKATESLATEMDKVAQMTGVSRREQEDALREKQKNARTQIAIEDAIAAGGKDAAISYQKMSTDLKGMGLDKLGDEIYAGQQFSKSSISMLTALGPAGTELQNSIAAVRDATNESERADANARLERAQVAVAERQQSKEYRDLARRGEGDVADAARAAWLSAQNYRESLAKIAEEGNVSYAKANEIAQATIKSRQENRDPLTNEKSAGAAATELYIKSMSRVSDAHVKFYEILQATNERFGAAVLRSGSIEDLKNVQNGKPFSKRAFGEQADRMEDDIRRGELFKNLNRLLYIGSEMAGHITTMTTDSIKIGTLFVNPGGKTEVETIEKNKSNKEQAEPTNKKSMADGSKALFGDWFGGNFGAGEDVTLHGNEAVIPREKLNAFLSDMQSQMGNTNFKFVDNMMSEMKNNMTNIVQKEEKPIENEGKQPNKVQEIPQINTFGTVTLKEIDEQLRMLNTTMGRLAATTSELLDTSTKQYRVTKQLSPNLNSR
jgi:hypothetical protein